MIGIGVLVSLSRGAWVAAVAAALMAAIAVNRNWRSYQLIGIVTSILAGIIIVSVIAGQISTSVQARIAELSPDAIAGDQRWDQWKDGLKAAIANFPGGSGLGTYGYAVLPFQSNTRAGWFREAHNQYLEIAVESGCVGILLLVGLIGLFLSRCVKTMKRSTYDRSKHYAIFGITLLVLAAVQSVADFVIAIPSNMFLYAILVSLVFTRCGWKAKITSRTEAFESLFWSAIVVVALTCSFVIVRGQLIERESLESTLVTAFERDSRADDAPAIVPRTLDRAIAQNPYSCLLYERRVVWNVMRYRCEIMDEADRRGEVSLARDGAR